MELNYFHRRERLQLSRWAFAFEAVLRENPPYGIIENLLEIDH
jgi:hypothetical protein